MKNSEIEIPAEFFEEAVKVQIPLDFIWGTQTPNEYSMSKTKSIRKGVSEYGRQFYFDHPIIAGLLSYEKGSVLFLVNGHHRAREAPRFKILAIPCLVYSLPLLAELANKTELKFKEEIEIATAQAVQEFDHHYNSTNKAYRPPRLMFDIKSTDELKLVSETSNPYGIIAVAGFTLLNDAK